MAKRQPRAYNSSLREQQAAGTRRRILDAAAQCFTHAGYAGTSLREIAEIAGVSVETVKLNGPKSDLLIAAFEHAFAGDEGPQRLEERDIGRQLLAVGDEDLVPAIVTFIAEANQRTHGLWAALVSTAASDQAMREWFEGLLSRRRRDVQRAIAEFDQRGMITSGADRDQLAAVLSFIVSPDSYVELVTQSGWSMRSYIDWLIRAVNRMVLDAPG